jgi:hypothetical protein
MKTQVEWAIIDGLPESQSRAAQRLLNDLEHYHAVRWVSVGNAVYVRFFKASEVRATSVLENEIFAESPQWIREFRKMDTRLAIKAALINSPTWWIPLAIVLLCYWHLNFLIR